MTGVTGSGKMSIEQQQEALLMLRDGLSLKAVAASFGVTKGVIAGIWHRQGEPVVEREPTKLFERCDALHARLDAVLTENVGVGKLPPEPRRAR